MLRYLLIITLLFNSAIIVKAQDNKSSLEVAPICSFTKLHFKLTTIEEEISEISIEDTLVITCRMSHDNDVSHEPSLPIALSNLQIETLSQLINDIDVAHINSFTTTPTSSVVELQVTINDVKYYINANYRQKELTSLFVYLEGLTQVIYVKACREIKHGVLKNKRNVFTPNMKKENLLPLLHNLSENLARQKIEQYSYRCRVIQRDDINFNYPSVDDADMIDLIIENNKVKQALPSH